MESWTRGSLDRLLTLQPVTVHSLLPKPPKETATTAAPPPIAAGSRIDFNEIRRHMRRGRHDRTADNGQNQTVPPPALTEIDRGVDIGEDIRVAIVIRMPRDPAELEMEERQSMMDDDEEKPGWESGMELGVWEGTVGKL